MLAVVTILRTYKRTIRVFVARRRIRDLCVFVFCKLFVSDEGGHFSLLDTLYRFFPSLATYPYKIEVEHTTRCNKNCILCEHTYWTEESRDLSFDEFRMIADQFPRLKWINITGEGSGFLNRDFLKIISYLRSRGVCVNFVDEFDFVDDRVARDLIAMGVNSVWISMDGATKETYEAIKVGCDFDRTLKNIRNFIRMRQKLGSPIPTLYFRFVVNRLNVSEMPRFIELIHSLGDVGDGGRVEFVGLLRFKEVDHLSLSRISPEILNATLDTAKRLGVRVSFSHAGKLRSIDKCVAWAEPYIMIGGYVLPCCAVLMSNNRPFLRGHSFGNVFSNSFPAIWNSERYRSFRQQVPRDRGQVPLLCRGCRAFDTTEREKKYGVSKQP
jgi:MoaA/NifB/PqqE/SkfB family radical SAM enzyme